MANTNAPFGLEPIRGGAGYNYSAAATLYSIPSTDTNAYYLGDAVKAAASGDANGVPNVIKITNGTDTLRGVIVGILPVYPQPSIQGTPLTLENPTIPSTKTTAYYVMVDDDPDSIFAMQDDGITTSKLVAASCNLNFSFTVTAGATLQSASASVILSSSFATTSTLNMKAMGLLQRPNNTFGSYAVWVCRINEHELGQPFQGV